MFMRRLGMLKNNEKITLTSFFDSNYLDRAIALIESVEFHTESNIIWKLLALDEITHSFLIENKKFNWEIIRLEDLNDPEVMQLMLVRPYREFCWSLSAILLDHVLGISQNEDLVAYVDSDCYFFSNINVLFGSLNEEKDFFIHEHNFPKNKEYLISRSGRFNVGVIGGKVSKQFKECVRKWRSQVIEKCVLDPANGFCGDQTYLDSWPREYERLRILKSDGIGAGPWNVNNKEIASKGKDILVNKEILVFYHFHAFKYNSSFGKIFVFQPALNYKIQRKPMKYIYRPYIQHLIKNSKRNPFLSKEISFNKKIFSLVRNVPRLFWSNLK